MLKRTIQRFCSWVLRHYYTWQHEEVKARFRFPSSVSVEDVSIEGNVVIGESTYINPGSRIDTGANSSVIIGSHCAIGRYVHITSKTHDNKRPTTDAEHASISHFEADVVIGNYVWIGDHAIIMPGVKIGDYAIIGGLSMVRNDVAPFEVVGGVPAKHIKYNTEHYKYHDRI